MADRSKRGFASMDPEKQRQIASKGGKAAHAKGTAHEFTRQEAVEAGRKGGKAAHAKGTAHRFGSHEAQQAGHNGGEHSGGGLSGSGEGGTPGSSFEGRTSGNMNYPSMAGAGAGQRAESGTPVL